jgi:hypothetical protein
MGRIMMVVTVWLVMAAMMLVIALPVIAKNNKEGPGDQSWVSGQGNDPDTSSASDVIHSEEGACVIHRGDTTPTGKTTGGGCEVT